MRFSLHGATLGHTNVAVDARVALDAGYDGIELYLPKLFRYLDVGYSAAELLDRLDHVDVTMLDVVMPIDARNPDIQRSLRRDCVRAARVAGELGCHTIQVVGIARYGDSDWWAHRKLLVSTLNDLADIAQEHDVKLAIEPVVFSTFHTLPRVLEVVHDVGTDRVGICLDTWHLWTTDTPVNEIADLDPALILAAQISDSGPMAAARWRDSDRSALPGEGILPLDVAIDAIMSTGYAGPWTLEMLSPRHWEWEPAALAHAMLERARPLVTAARDRHAMLA
jgi:sugar phosphate isomerase/epimerase